MAAPVWIYWCPARNVSSAAPKPVRNPCRELRSCLERRRSAYDLPISWSDHERDPSGGNAGCLVLPAPAPATPAVKLRSGARVTRLHVNPSGREVKGVEASIAA